ncbi:MAG: sulfatase, partial [Kiritimatiellales bacterium]
MSRKKPNILLIVTDQQRPDLFGAAGRIPIQTPAEDRLCKEGVMFKRAYSPCPLCTPARATLVSGQYPSRHRAWSIGVDTPMDVLSLPQILREQGGYRTGIIGKSHLLSCHREGSLEALPHIRDLDYFRKWTGPWFGFEYAKISVGHVAENHAYSMHYGVWLENHGVPAEPPYFSRTCDAHEVIGADRQWALPEEMQSCAWVAEETINYLGNHANNHSDEPFYLSVNFPEPHPPFMAPEPWNSMYDDVELPPPNRREGEWEDKSTLYKATVQNRLNELGWHDSVPMACQFVEGSEGEVRTTEEIRKWKSYMGMQSMLDKYLGKILDRLDELDLANDTLVIYTADHGDFMGDHYIWHKGGSHYDGSARVPFIVRWPGKVPAGVQSTALQSLVDIPSTVLAAAELPIHDRMQGTNQMGTWCNPAQLSRSGVLIDHRVEKGLYVNSWI